MNADGRGGGGRTEARRGDGGTATAPPLLRRGRLLASLRSAGRQRQRPRMDTGAPASTGGTAEGLHRRGAGNAEDGERLARQGMPGNSPLGGDWRFAPQAPSLAFGVAGEGGGG